MWRRRKTWMQLTAGGENKKKTNQLPEFLIQRLPSVPHMFIAKQSLSFFFPSEETISILNFGGLYSLSLSVC